MMCYVIELQNLQMFLNVIQASSYLPLTLRERQGISHFITPIFGAILSSFYYIK